MQGSDISFKNQTHPKHSPGNLTQNLTFFCASNAQEVSYIMPPGQRGCNAPCCIYVPPQFVATQSDESKDAQNSIVFLLTSTS